VRNVVPELIRGASRGRRHRSPAHRWSGISALILLAWFSTGCEREPSIPSDPELRAELGIPDDVPIHRVDLSGRADETRVIPRNTSIRPGDLVQFVVLDRRVHLIRFDEGELPPDLWRFLVATSQDRPPPLVERGARLVLSFEEAPEGVYSFRVEGNGPAIPGEITVLAP
jgi:plastocyanin